MIFGVFTQLAWMFLASSTLFLTPTRGNFCVNPKAVSGKAGVWGTCDSGDVRVKSSGTGGGGTSIVQHPSAKICVGSKSAVRIAGSIQQNQDSLLKISRFGQFYQAPGISLVMGKEAQIIQEEDESWYSEVNLHHSTSLGSKSKINLNTYSYLYVNGPLTLGNGTRVDIGFRASLYIYSCGGMACVIGGTSHVVLDTAAVFNNFGSLTVGAQSLFHLGPNSIMNSVGSLFTEHGTITLGERSELITEENSTLSFHQGASLTLGKFAGFKLETGSTLQMFGRMIFSVEERALFHIRSGMFCMVIHSVRVPAQTTIVLEKGGKIPNSVTCHTMPDSPNLNRRRHK